MERTIQKKLPIVYGLDKNQRMAIHQIGKEECMALIARGSQP